MELRTITLAILATLTFGCGGGSSSSSQTNPPTPPVTEPDDPSDPSVPVETVAPFSLAQYKTILEGSTLQVSDPNGAAGNKDTIYSDEFDGYKTDHFYAEKTSEELVFSMSGYSMRSEVRELTNFDVNQTGIKRTLNASVKLPNIDVAMANSDASKDEVTFLQIHNKGTESDGTGGIPHPLLRVVWEQERNSQFGHYWAVLKINALNCDQSSSSACDGGNSYERIDLGKADINNFTDFALSVFENTLTISVNDQVIHTRDIEYWEHLLSYFKAGVYNQFDNGTANVHFKELRYSETPFDGTNRWDIDSWKITIPPSRDDWYGSGGSNAAELEPARCQSSSKDVLSNNSNIIDETVNLSYFNVENGRMHFRTDMSYGVSTANSSYIRSELRELYRSSDNPDCSTGDTDTSWYIDDERTDATQHKLSANIKIEQYPNISNQLPKVVVGQIHGFEIKQALVKLLWEGNGRPVRAVLNDDFERDNQSCDHCESFSVDLGTYSAGEAWRYTIHADETALTVTTSDDNGENPITRTLRWGDKIRDNNGDYVTFSQDWAASDVAYYFKAGIYPQFTPKESYRGEIFDVSFGEVTVEHY
ncbi:polysaccharide lyase family 7 protein [Vibrio sp. SM6]|uniref:Polysaccharide lyase family 7 protein n=1 Tax=Vibrio agarilyticus TaxID=2726741 RepID=A0A7X8TT17_9VIBR|nr:polysaccharide lyase family 7 protein [Vibrio agarilyticus]NLS13768.1 polysaccharide lyase family 7 protein [Vibrio agarilyticus]